MIAGCGGCGRRRAQLAGIWAAIDPTKAINLHSTRSATERKGGADLIGAGLEWFHSRITRTAGGVWGGSITSFGDKRSQFPLTGYQTEIFVNGSLYVTCPTESGTAFSPSTSWNTSCGLFSTPNGVTIIDYDSAPFGPVWVDPSTNTHAMRFVNSSDPSDVVITLDPMTFCLEIGTSADWKNPSSQQPT